MSFTCQRCGACCKLAGGKGLSCHPDGSCLHLQKYDGTYYCDIFSNRPDTCRSAYVIKTTNLTPEQYSLLAPKICKLLAQAVEGISYHVDTKKLRSI